MKTLIAACARITGGQAWEQMIITLHRLAKIIRDSGPWAHEKLLVKRKVKTRKVISTTCYFYISGSTINLSLRLLEAKTFHPRYRPKYPTDLTNPSVQHVQHTQFMIFPYKPGALHCRYSTLFLKWEICQAWLFPLPNHCDVFSCPFCTQNIFQMSLNLSVFSMTTVIQTTINHFYYCITYNHA